MKPETRNPKAERSPKSETRNPKADALNQPGTQSNSDFGLRPSAFSRPSTLDPRPSRFFRPSTLGPRPFLGPRPSAFGFPAGFTLIELLVVIAIIAILAAMVIPITGAVNRNKIKAKARGELERVATAIDLYKAKLGHYPPDAFNSPYNQLYFELLGTTFTNGTYVTLDGSAQVKASTLQTVFGAPARVGGIINTTQGMAGDEGRVSSSFLPSLKPDEVVSVFSTPNGENVKALVAGVPAPANYTNFISYVSSNPTNNPNSFDLWVDVVISGKTNRISNWTKEIVTLP